MIYEALALIKQELSAYLESLDPNDLPSVQLGGATDGAEQQTDRLLISLVNVAEEATLKNLSPYQRTPAGSFEVVNPPVYLNLFVLVTVNFQNAETALKRLAQVVQCFQRRRELATTRPFRSFDDQVTIELRLNLDLCSPSFEQISQIWGTLGGQQKPFVLYKVRLVEEQAREVLGQGPEIQQIERRYSL